MPLDLDEARHIARLARLEIDPETEHEVVDRLAAVVRYFDTLVACDTRLADQELADAASRRDQPTSSELASSELASSELASSELAPFEEQDTVLPGLAREVLMANRPGSQSEPGMRAEPEMQVEHDEFFSVPAMLGGRAGRGGQRA